MVEKKVVENEGPYCVLEKYFSRFNRWAVPEPLFQELSRLEPRKEESIEELAEFVLGDYDTIKGVKKKT